MSASGGRLLLDGLIAVLPPAGSIWPQAEREQWFALARAIFAIVYPEPRVTSETDRAAAPEAP